MRSHRQQRGPGRAAWFGGEGRLLEWRRLTTPIGGGPATARL